MKADLPDVRLRFASPRQADFVIEDCVDPLSLRHGGSGPVEPLRDKGLLGDRTGYYTLPEPYPAFLHVIPITHCRRFCRLVALWWMKYSSAMKTLSVQEASQNLGRWVRRAMGGEQIAIHEGACAVLLQPLSGSPESPAPERLSPREALRLMQEESRLTPDQAEQYMVHARGARGAAGG